MEVVKTARQEDAHEYMVNLLESMHKCCLPSGVPSESPSAYEKSLVHKIFGGRLRSQVTYSLYLVEYFDIFVSEQPFVFRVFLDMLQIILEIFLLWFVHNVFLFLLQVKCMQCSYCSNKFDPSLYKALANFTAAEELDGGERQY